jgi:hypothetical protein
MAHLSDQELLELALTDAAPGRPHVAGCALCRERAESARDGLLLAASAGIPEPSPLYWESFRQQVGRRIAAEAAPRPRFALWGGGVLALAASLALVAAIVPRPPSVATPVGVQSASGVLPAWSPLPPAEEDPGLEVLAAAVAPLPAESAACSGVADCVTDLSEQESRDLAALLRQEMTPGRDL